jgi:trehalose 6-phosphate phosphatase
MTALRTPDRSEIAYFFDLDGTLVDIVDSPAQVRPGHEIRLLIETLDRSVGGALALITGRSIADIDHLFPDSHLCVAGQHGVERRDASGAMSQHGHRPPHLDLVRDRLAASVGRHPGLILEDKGLSLALHYRRAPQFVAAAHRLMHWACSTMGQEYCLQVGKSVVELKPAGKDKGAAVADFMAEAPFAGRTPIFVGDDVTDEYGFDVVNRLGGYSVKVGAGPTTARWRLPNARAVIEWLSHGQPAPHHVIHTAGAAVH